MTQNELIKAIEAGRTDFCGEDLRWADLRLAYLRWVDLSETEPRWADLRETYMTGVKL